MSLKPHIPTLLLIILFQVVIGAEKYRLPQSVKPVKYDIIITLNTDVFSTEKFKGQVNITLNILNQTREIQIHAKNLTNIILKLSDVRKTYNITHISNPLTEILSITTEEDLRPGQYFLFATYDGIFSNDSTGLYKSTYKNKTGGIEYLATTQIGLTHARKVFLCFDEPEMKATFNLSVVYPKGYKVLANTLQNNNVTEISSNLEMVNFRTTPLMSSYLVAFIVSNFTCDDLSIIRVCSRPESENERNIVLNAAPKLLQILENMTGISYNVSGIGKLDLAAIPDFYYSGMENWGLITFKERALLQNENFSSNAHQQRAITLVAHELAHMWFGDLVTTRWWSDAFLNEGLATYFEYFAAAEFKPTWELDQQFVLENVHTAFVADSSATAQPLSSNNINTPAEILNRFDQISYNKGGSILRMMAHVMGNDNFLKGLQYYLQQYKFNNTLAPDLWNSFQNFSIFHVPTIATNWTFEAGYPVINVRISNSRVIISQERFLWSGNSSTKWYVPITYTTSNDSNKFNITSPQIWLTPIDNEVTLPGNVSDWIILNNLQTGYYRINYDNVLWNRIETALKKNHTDINVINRAQIVDDLFNFALAGKIPYSRVLDIISYLKNDTDYYPWYSAFNSFSGLLPKIANACIRQQLENYINDSMNQLYQSTPFSTEDLTNQIYSLKQELAITWACKLGRSDCVNNSKQIFSAYKTGLNSRKNLKTVVYCTSLRHSTNIEEDWNFVWNEFKQNNIGNEQAIMLSVLGCTSNQTILYKYLTFSINASSEIRKQDFSSVISSVVKNNPVGVNVTLQFLIDNYEKLLDFYRDESYVTTVIIIAGTGINQQAQIDKLSSLVQSGRLTNNIRVIAEYVIKATSNNLQAIKKLENELFLYFQGKKNMASMNHPEITYFSCILIFSSYFY